MWHCILRHKLLQSQSAGTKPVSSHAASNITQTMEYNVTHSGAQSGWPTGSKCSIPNKKGRVGGVAFFPTEAPAVGACDAVRSPPLFFFCILVIYALCGAFFSCFVPHSHHLQEMCSGLALKVVRTDMIRKAGLIAHALRLAVWPAGCGRALLLTASVYEVCEPCILRCWLRTWHRCFPCHTSKFNLALCFREG